MRALLAEIEPAPYKALLTQAQGALRRDQALLQAARIDLGDTAGDTFGNSVESVAWMRANKFKTMRLVTADYHMPRAILEIRRCLPATTLYEVPVRPPAISHLFGLPTLRLLAVEYTKYLLVRSGLFDMAANDLGNSQ